MCLLAGNLINAYFHQTFPSLFLARVPNFAPKWENLESFGLT